MPLWVVWNLLCGYPPTFLFFPTTVATRSLTAATTTTTVTTARTRTTSTRAFIGAAFASSCSCSSLSRIGQNQVLPLPRIQQQKQQQRRTHWFHCAATSKHYHHQQQHGKKRTIKTTTTRSNHNRAFASTQSIGWASRSSTTTLRTTHCFSSSSSSSSRSTIAMLSSSTGLSMSRTTQEQKQQQEQHLHKKKNHNHNNNKDVSQAQQSLDLFDVDCNLWHSDLQSFLSPSVLQHQPLQQEPPSPQEDKDVVASSSSSREQQEEEELQVQQQTLMANPWQLLQYDDTSQIIAMLTPCSTLTESRKAVATLVRYHQPIKQKEDKEVLGKEEEEEQSQPNPYSHNSVMLHTTLGVHPYHVTDDDVSTLGGPTLNDNIQICMQELRDLYYQQAQQQQQHLIQPNNDNNNVDDKYSNKNKNNWVVAMGECGLDRAPGFPPLEEYQLPWFRAQIALAHELHLPLFIHERLAFDETILALQEQQEKEILLLQQEQQQQQQEHQDARIGHDGHIVPVPVLIHCFTGTVQQLETYLECGYYISLAGGFLAKAQAATTATSTTVDDDDNNNINNNARDVAQALPRLWKETVFKNRFMLETDAPYMGFKDCRNLYLQKHDNAIQTMLSSKKRKRLQSSTYPNVPSSLEQVLNLVHSYLNHDDINNNNTGHDNVISRQELAQITTANARRFFGLSTTSTTIKTTNNNTSSFSSSSSLPS